jgi:hypothetical protein
LPSIQKPATSLTAALVGLARRSTSAPPGNLEQKEGRETAAALRWLSCLLRKLAAGGQASWELPCSGAAFCD